MTMRVDPRSFLTMIPLRDMPPFPWRQPSEEQEVVPPTKPKALSLRGLLAWLQKKDPEQDYDYKSGASCLLAQYLTSRLAERVWVGTVTYQTFVGPSAFSFTHTRTHLLPQELNAVAMARPWTFGAAAERCRDLLRQGYE
jgi:hypothetical protein